MWVWVPTTTMADESNKISFGIDLNKLLVPAFPQPVNGADTVTTQQINDYYSMTVVSSWFKSFTGQFNTINASIGGEYTYNDQFAFRLGYFYENKDQGGRQYFTMGVGLKYNMLGLNFSYLIPSGSITKTPIQYNPLLDWYLIWTVPQSVQPVQISNLKNGGLGLSALPQILIFSNSSYVISHWTRHRFSPVGHRKKILAGRC